MSEPKYDAVGASALYSYLSGGQDGQDWALIDNLTGDDLRDVCRHAILLLMEAHAGLALASVALDGMTPRAQRFAARDAALAIIDPYLDRLTERFGIGPLTPAMSQGDDTATPAGERPADTSLR
jgi:hypothetical protein